MPEPVTDEAFVEVYNSSDTAAQAADRLGMTYAATTGRAFRLRRIGFFVTKKPTRKRSIQYHPLDAVVTAIIAEEIEIT